MPVDNKRPHQWRRARARTGLNSRFLKPDSVFRLFVAPPTPFPLPIFLFFLFYTAVFTVGGPYPSSNILFLCAGRPLADHGHESIL